MKRRVFPCLTMALCSCLFLAILPVLAAQDQAAEKLGKLSQVLNLSPEQKAQLAPILEKEGPKLEAIKNNPSLSGREKKKELKSVHEQTDPLVKSILNPTQYQQWQTIRKDEIEQMKESGGGL